MTIEQTSGLDTQWSSARAARTELIQVSQYCPERAYVEVRLPNNIGAVRRVIFKTTSHDQGKHAGPSHSRSVLTASGFSDTADKDGGTYNQSYTSFEARILAPIGHDRSHRIVFQANIHADFTFRQHENVWNFDDNDPSHQNWLGSIKGGDLVQIIPRAQYLAWLNYVKSAELEVFWENATIQGSRNLTPGNVPGHPLRNDDFPYQPLDELNSQIRLITLKPGSFSEPIACYMTYVSLNDKSQYEYESLSYCWGNRYDTRPINIEHVGWDASTGENRMLEYTFHVTESVETALRQLRRDDDKERVLWIDQICINQGDTDERARQVALMKDIYAQAREIIVWLGESDFSTRKFVQLVNTIRGRYEHITRGSVASTDVAMLHKEPFFRVGDGPAYHAFVDCDLFFEHGWFKRAWILQEVFNGSSISVYCGPDIIPWSAVLRANRCINMFMRGPSPLRKSIMPSVLADLFELVDVEPSGCRLGYITRRGRTGILDVVLRGLDLEATDPRDKIFALLQFGEETHDREQIDPTVLPNYGKDVAHLFADFTRWWIKEHRSLRILSTVHVSEGRTWQAMSGSTFELQGGRPSWCMWYDGVSSYARGTLGLLESASSRYKAAGDTIPDRELLSLQQESSPMTLYLTGRIVGTIRSIGPFPFYESDTRSAHPGILEAYESIFDPANRYTIWTTALQRDLSLETDDSDRIERYQIDHLRAHQEYAKRSLAIQCHSDSYFRTTDGKLGLCPQTAREGNVIVVLHGGKVPYLLRKRAAESLQGDGQKPQWEFVGECYLENYMNGEAMVEQEEQHLDSEVFELV